MLAPSQCVSVWWLRSLAAPQPSHVHPARVQADARALLTRVTVRSVVGRRAKLREGVNNITRHDATAPHLFSARSHTQDTGG